MHSPQLYGFLDPVSIQKTGRAFAFLFFLRLIEIAVKLLPSFLKKNVVSLYR
jgi:hypothetical protein